MTFNRYDILTAHYTNEIRRWRWDQILSGLCEYEPEGGSDEKFEGRWIGSILGLYPSGKIYAPWTTNQTRADTIRDECFYDALEGVAASFGLFLDTFDDNVFVVRRVEDSPSPE
jgi:hypothetical protein